MLLTEEEARDKWCPFVRYFSQRFGTVQNRWVSEHDTQTCPDAARCIASQCTAWRWYAAFVDNEAAPKAAKDDYVKQIGYCGLAGKPE